VRSQLVSPLRRLSHAALAALALAAGCTGQQRVATETTLASVLIPTEQEKQLGLQVKEQLETQEHIQYLEDPAVNAYVQGITGKILASAKKDRPDVDWSVKVINDPKTVNAFATPGGFLYVYSGLLLAADDTAEVAGVLGHEAGHVVARHSARQMVDAMGLEAVAALALGQNPSALSQVVAGAGGKGLMLANSRSDETEADEYGARYASGAGYDPNGLITFFEKLSKLEGQQPGFAKFLSDHPTTPDRITHLQQFIAEHHLSATGGRTPGELPAVKARIPKAGGGPGA
jgi:predicted Zn-dependent protease